jgi:hypothetical protein
VQLRRFTASREITGLIQILSGTFAEIMRQAGRLRNSSALRATYEQRQRGACKRNHGCRNWTPSRLIDVKRRPTDGRLAMLTENQSHFRYKVRNTPEI